MIHYLFFVLLFCSHKLDAQQKDTIYLNKFYDTTDKASAHYVRVIDFKNNGFDLTEYFTNGKIHQQGFYSSLNPIKREGYFKYYHENGILQSEGMYQKNELTGLWKNYDNESNLKSSIYYQNDKKEGVLKSYFKDQKLRREEMYKNGEMVKSQCYRHSGEDTAYYPFEEQAKFKGGDEELYRYLAKKIRYPKESTKAKSQGKVRLRFMVEEDGLITNIEVIEGVDKYIDQEAMRVVAEMPNWKPGTYEGTPVKNYFNLPIKFTLD